MCGLDSASWIRERLYCDYSLIYEMQRLVTWLWPPRTLKALSRYCFALDRFETVRSIVASTKAANDFEISSTGRSFPKDPLLNRARIMAWNSTNGALPASLDSLVSTSETVSCASTFALLGIRNAPNSHSDPIHVAPWYERTSRPRNDLINALYREIKLELADAMMSDFPGRRMFVPGCDMYGIAM